MKSLILHIFLFQLIFLNVIFSQDSIGKKTDTTQMLAEVVVTATRNATKVFQLPYSVNVVSQKAASQKGLRTTPEALMGTVGVFVQKTNHGGGSVFIRGLTGNQTLMMLDGIRLNNAIFRYGPNQYLNTIDLYSLGKIEVIKGSGSVQHGSDALGGVIQLFTKDISFGKKSFSANAIGKVVSQDMEYTVRGEMNYTSENFVFSAGYTNRRFGDLIGGDTTGRQSPSGYTEQAVDLKMMYRLGNQTSLTLVHQNVSQKDVPLYHRIQLENYNRYHISPQERKLSYLKIESNTLHPIFEKIHFVLSTQESFENRTYQKNNNVNKFSEQDQLRNYSATLDIFSRFNNNWTSNSGIEGYFDKVYSSKWQESATSNSTKLLRGLYPNEATSNNYSIFFLQHFAYNKFDIEAGIRYNQFELNIPDSSQINNAIENVRITPSSLVMNFAIGFQLSNQSRIYSSISSGYRAPNIDDMGSLGLVDFRYELPAYSLKPETSYHTELGYRYRDAKMQSSVSLFYLHLTDLITRIQMPGQQVNGYNVYKKVNSQNSYISGIEFELDYLPISSLHFNIGATYIYGQNLSANEPMRRIPPFNGKAQLQYDINKWYFILEDVFAAKQSRLAKGDIDDNRIPLGGTPDWNIVNFSTGHTLKKLTIKSGIYNLFNIDYRTHGSGINGIGRSVWLSFQWSI